MERYNAFNQIHKALRVLMYDTATLISQTDFDNTQQEENAVERVNRVLTMFDHHAHHEDTMVFPLLSDYEPAVVDAFEQEHVTDHTLSERLKGFLTALTLAISPEAKKQLGASLATAFTEFMIFNLQHMQKEETIVNKLLWKYYSDVELAAMSQKIAASISPEEMAIASKWMMRGLSNNEITAWLRNVERHAPHPIFRRLFATAEEELDQQRFRQVLDGITGTVKVAS